VIVYHTGAAGFLASHLSERFVSAGHTVVGIDNFVTGNRRNLAALEGSPAFHFIEADVGAPWAPWIDAAKAMAGPPDCIVHAASPASPVDYGRDPLGTLHVNALGTIEAVALAQSCGARVFLFSTSECYGDPLEHPQRESYWGNVNPVGQRACYDESKRFAEAYLTSAARVHGLDARIVRIFNTYGPRMQPNDGRVIPNFAMSALNGNPLTIYGDGSQTRSFCYVDDLVDGIFRFIALDGLGGNIINIGNPGEFTIRELASIVAEIAGVELHVVEQALPPDDPTRRRPDISLARTLLGWEPRVALRDGLAKTLEYFRTEVVGAR
jgi:nucleoside-diphosphate-sugar epimerase